MWRCAGSGEKKCYIPKILFSHFGWFFLFLYLYNPDEHHPMIHKEMWMVVLNRDSYHTSGSSRNKTESTCFHAKSQWMIHWSSMWSPVHLQYELDTKNIFTNSKENFDDCWKPHHQHFNCEHRHKASHVWCDMHHCWWIVVAPCTFQRKKIMHFKNELTS